MGFFVSKEEGKKPHPNTGRAAYRIPEERYAAARVLYESVPGMTFLKLAEETGVSFRALENKSYEQGWKKAPLLPQTGMTEAAQQVADRYTGKLADYGDDISAEQKQVALKDTAVEVAVDMRAQLLDRHRREWGAIRNLVYGNIKTGEFNDKCKLAKISAETLQIMQQNERKAWGLDKQGDGDVAQGVTVIIERS